jgi:hypothetical protein
MGIPPLVRTRPLTTSNLVLFPTAGDGFAHARSADEPTECFERAHAHLNNCSACAFGQPLFRGTEFVGAVLNFVRLKEADTASV